MTAFTRKLVFASAALCFAAVLGAASPALAKTHHHHPHAKAAHHVATSREVIRIAQRRLHNLGYYTGKNDGKMGKQTRDAIKHFQHDHMLKQDGVLTAKTRQELEYADHPKVLGTHSFRTIDNVTSYDMSRNADMPVNPQYATSLNGGTKVVSSRFARVDVSESGSGSAKRYNINLNGQPILIADGQPSVINISPTYDLDNEDAVVFTTFSPNASGCVYSTHVLALNNQGSKLLDLDNCTRDFNAVAKNGSLFITFPQKDSNSAIGSTWRLEGTDLQRL
jgi:hypothetical protein